MTRPWLKHTNEVRNGVTYDVVDVLLTAENMPEFIACATERHCDYCGGKIDRVEAPEGCIGAPDGAVMDGRGMWPVWHHHSIGCELRVVAGLAGLR